MTLPAFIQRMLGFAEKTEKTIESLAANNAELNKAKERIAELEKTLEEAVSEGTASLTKISELTKQLDEAKGQVNTLTAKVAELEKSVSTEKSRANETIAAQGIPADKLPAAAASTAPNAGGGINILQSYNNISDPQERDRFYAKNKSAIREALAKERKG